MRPGAERRRSPHGAKRQTGDEQGCLRSYGTEGLPATISEVDHCLRRDAPQRTPRAVVNRAWRQQDSKKNDMIHPTSGGASRDAECYRQRAAPSMLKLGMLLPKSRYCTVIFLPLIQ